MCISHTYKAKPKLYVIYAAGIGKWGIVVLLWSHLSVVVLYGSEERQTWLLGQKREETLRDGIQTEGRGSAQGSERLWATQSSAFCKSVANFGWHRRLNLCSNVRLWCSLLLHVAMPNTTGVNSLPFMHMTQLLWKLVSTWKPGEQAVHSLVENSYLYFFWSMILNLGYTLKSPGSLKNGGSHDSA